MARRLVLLAVGLLVSGGCYGGVDDLPEVPPPPAAQPIVEETITFEGTGRSSESIRLEPGGPLFFAAQARREEKFSLKLVMSPGRQEIVLFDQRGPVDARAALWPSAIPATTTAKLEVQAVGAWSLLVDHPKPPSDPVALPGVLEGRGFDVFPVRVGDRSLRSLSVRYRGKESIFVILIPYEEFAHGIPLLDEQGPVKRRVEIEPPPPGSYLLHVRALGPWRVALAP